MPEIATGMILAAGLGTRLQPFTLHHPKALAIVDGKTVLERNIAYLQQHGIFKVVVNVHHFAKQVIDCLKSNNGFGSAYFISDETGALLETGGGLKNALPFFNDADKIVLLNADILTNLNLSAMMDYHVQHGADATLAVSGRDSTRKFLFDEHLQLAGWQNYNSGEVKISRQVSVQHALAFSGLHIIGRSIFAAMPFDGKFSIIDVYLHRAAKKRIIGYRDDDAMFIDIGTPEKLEQAQSMAHLL